MNEAKQIRVTFFQIQSNAMKRDKLVSMANAYFKKKTKLLFYLPNEESLHYLDLLLWRFPPESFLPHSVSQKAVCDDFIVLTNSIKTNPSGARSLFNLCQDPLENPDLSFTQIYEFEDLSSSPKNKIAQDHYRFYKKKGYTVITL